MTDRSVKSVSADTADDLEFRAPGGFTVKGSPRSLVHVISSVGTLTAVIGFGVHMVAIGLPSMNAGWQKVTEDHRAEWVRVVKECNEHNEAIAARDLEARAETVKMFERTLDRLIPQPRKPGNDVSSSVETSGILPGSR